MKRWLTTLAVLAGWAGLAAHSAMAQPYMQPQTNPYPTQGLPNGLLLTPNNPYIQYYGLGQGMANNARAVNQLQQQVNQTGLTPLGMGAGGLQPYMLTTGHQVSFQNTSHYFPTGGQAFAGMGTGGGGYPGAGGYGAGGYGGGYGGVGGYPGAGGYGGYGGMGGYGIGGFGYGVGGAAPNVNTQVPQGTAQFPR